LRHRLLLSFEAEAEGITSDDLIQRLISLVAIP
jgi:MoxR-like ATPase